MSTGNSQKKALQPGQFRTQQGSPFNHVVDTGCSIDLLFPTFYVLGYLRIFFSSVPETFISLKYYKINIFITYRAGRVTGSGRVS